MPKMRNKQHLLGYSVLFLLLMGLFFIYVRRTAVVQPDSAKETLEIKQTQPVIDSPIEKEMEGYEGIGKEVYVPDERAEIVLELLEKELPITPNFRETVKARIYGKTTEDMVREIGDMWSAVSPYSSQTFMINGYGWLNTSFLSNLHVKEVIELGREGPEYVGNIISEDLICRINNWVNVAQACTDSEGKGGYLLSNEGDKLGSDAVIKYHEETYAIQAEIFVLMNINYSKSLDVLAEFCNWYKTPIKSKVKIIGENGAVVEVWASNAPDVPNRQKCFNSDILFGAISYLVQYCDDERFENVKKKVDDYFKESSPSIHKITDSPDALWSVGNPATSLAGVDMSSEPKMELHFLNDSVVTDQLMYQFVKASVINELAAVYE